MNDHNSRLKLVAPHYNVAIYKGFIRYLENKFGNPRARQIVESTGLPWEHFQNDTNWVSEDFADLFYDILDQVEDIDPDYAYRSAKISFSHEAVGALVLYVSKLVTPRFIYGAAISVAQKFNKIDELHVKSFANNHLVMEYRSRRTTKHLQKNMDTWVGSLEAIPTLFGLPPATVQSTLDGNTVTFDVTWRAESKLFLLRRLEIAAVLGAGVAGIAFVASWMIWPFIHDPAAIAAGASLASWVVLNKTIKRIEAELARITTKEIASFIEHSNTKTSELHTTLVKLDKRYKEANLLAKVIQRLSQVKDLNELLNTSLREIKDTLEYDRVFFMRFDRTKNILETQVSQGFKDNIARLINSYSIDLNVVTPEKFHFGNIFKRRENMLIPVTKDYFATLSEAGKMMINITGSSSFLVCTVATQEHPYGLLIVDYSNPLKTLNQDDLHIAQNLANQLAICFSNLLALEKEKTLRLEFQKYVPAKVIQSMSNVSEGTGVDLRRGVTREVSVLFSDIRGFTARSVTNDPEIFVNAMNYYFNVMSEIVYGHQGIVDKFIGDAVLALFNPFGENPDHATLAVQAAFEMQRVLPRVNQFIRASIMRGTWDDFHIGIGVHSGSAILGTIGSEYKKDYTAMGETVNVASRVESMCKKFGDSIILVSDSTQAQINHAFSLKSLGQQEIRGTNREREIFQVTGEYLETKKAA